MTLFLQLPLTTPFPGPQSVIVLDNAHIHKSPEVQELIEGHGRLLPC